MGVGRREQGVEAGAQPPSDAVGVGAATPGRRSYKLPIAALLLLALVWGYSWVVMKIALDYVQPWTFAALRTVIGGVALLALLPLLKRPLKPKAAGPTAVLGVLQTTGFVGLAHLGARGRRARARPRSSPTPCPSGCCCLPGWSCARG